MARQGKEVSIITDEQKKQLNAKLKELAVAAIDNETNRFCLRQKFVEGVFGDSSLFQLALEVGWLNQVGVDAKNPNQRVYAFFHPTFEEYFAALAIDDWDFFLPRAHDNDNPKPVSERYRIFEPQWKEVILLWLGREDVLKEQKEEIIKALVEFEDGCSNYYKFRAYSLAAAGIAEFRCCTRADEIVAQVAEWAFGRFKVEEYKWQTLRELIPETARATLRETERSKAIVELVKRINLTEEYIVICKSIKLLGEMGIGNSQAIKSLEATVELPDAKFSMIHIQATKALLKINPKSAIGFQNLLELINQTEYEHVRKQAIEVVGQVGKIQQEFIPIIEQIVDQPNEYLDLLVQAANTLGKIDPSNSNLVPILVKFIEQSEDEINLKQRCEDFIKIGLGDYWNSLFLQLNQPIHYENARSKAFEILERIAPYNSDVIPKLVQIIDSTKDEDIRYKAIVILGTIGRDNSEAITTLERLIEPNKPENLCRIAAENLEKIYPNHPRTINELVRLTKSAQDENTCFLAARSLGEIGRSNFKAIKTLEQFINFRKIELTHRLVLVAESLWKIDPDNPMIIPMLEKLIEPDNDERTRWLAAERLGRIYSNHPKAIAELVKLVKSTKTTHRRVADSLNKILRQEDRMIEVVAALKEYLSDETHENNRHRYRECYKVIWHCAQNMTYPDFYQAWHQQEGVDNTTTPNSQMLNQADLPQNLQSAIANTPQLSQIIHLICIDSSKFIDPDRPAAKIYTEMVKRGCPKCDDGTPKTMAELQIYWDLLEIEFDKRVVLVFYASSTDTTSAKGTATLSPYSETFLLDLSKFGDRICVITHQSFNHIPLKFFTPSHAIEDVKDWLRTIDLPL